MTLLDRVRDTQEQVIERLKGDGVLIAKLAQGADSIHDHLPLDRNLDQPFIVVGPVDVGFQSQDLKTFSCTFQVTVSLVWSRQTVTNLNEDIGILADVERLLTKFIASGSGWITHPFQPEVATTTPDAELGYDGAIRFRSGIFG